MERFRYSLDKSSKKFVCPNCNKKTFVLYIDTETKKTTFVELSKERELLWIETADSPPFIE